MGSDPFAAQAAQGIPATPTHGRARRTGEGPTGKGPRLTDTASGAAIATPAGPEFAAYVSEQLEAEEKRRTSLEARGLAVITTSGTVVTLLLALAALVTKSQDFQLPESAQPWVITAVVSFVAAAALGIAANAPQLYRAVDPRALELIIRERWSVPADDALKTLTATRLADLERAQKANDLKGWALLGAVVSQGVAIACLTISIWIILAS